MKREDNSRGVIILLAILAWVLLFASADTSAAEINAIVDTWSLHSERPAELEILSGGLDVPPALLEKYRPEWNEHNRALGLEYVFDADGWEPSVVLAHYTDSYSRDTWYGGFGAMYPLVESGKWRVDTGGYALYFRHEGYTIPLAEPGFEWLGYRVPGRRRFAVVPGAQISYGRVGINVAVIPPINSGPWTGVLQLEIRLWSNQ